MAEASTEIKKSLLFFGEDVLSTKFPSYVDGFKDITRRIIWYSRDKRDYVSFASAMGEIAAHHVGGDSSVYGAIIRLGQQFMLNNPLIDIEGKSGEYFAPGDSAAPRYLKMRISEFARDLFFNNVHPKTLPMQPTKDFSGTEPRYFIPRIPTALIMGNLTVGFGFKSTIPLIDLSDVCDLVMTYADWYEKKNIGIPPLKNIVKHLIPSFPIQNLLKNKDELLQAYRENDFSRPVAIEGWVDINGNSITVRAVPYGTDFGTVTQKLREVLQDRKHWLWDFIVSANQYSSSEAEFTMEIKRGRNPFVVLDKLRSILQFSKRWTPIHSYMKDGRALTLDPPTLTYLWYQERSIAIAGGLKYRQSDLLNKKMATEAILHIADHTDEVIKIIRSADPPEKAIDLLHERFEGLTWKQARILCQQTLLTLSRAAKENLLKELAQIDMELETTLSKFHRIHETIYQEAQLIKKKYSTPKVTKISSNFMGYVRFGRLGIINFFTMEEMYDLLNSKAWPGSAYKYIGFYNSKMSDVYLVRNSKLTPLVEMTKEITTEDVIALPYHKLPFNFIIHTDKTVSITDKSEADRPEGVVVCPIGPQYYAIHKNGTITLESIDPKLVRRNATKGLKSDVIYAVPNDAKDMVILHMNKNEQNILRADRIFVDGNPGNIRTVIAGHTHVLGVYPIDSGPIWLTITKDFTKNNSLDWLCIKNLKNLMKEDHLLINIAKTQSNPLGNYLKRHNTVRSLFILDVVEEAE